MKGIAERKEKTALDILNDDADTLAVSFRSSGYALSSLTFATEATVEENLSILGGLLSAVTAKLQLHAGHRKPPQPPYRKCGLLSRINPTRKMRLLPTLQKEKRLYSRKRHTVRFPSPKKRERMPSSLFSNPSNRVFRETICQSVSLCSATKPNRRCQTPPSVWKTPSCSSMKRSAKAVK